MICERCGKRSATVHFTQIINGEKTELHLCQECAAAEGEIGFVDPQLTFQSFLGKVLENEFKFHGQVQAGNVRCSNCGLTYNDFRRLGQLGCSECYNQFSRQLEPLLRKLHGTARHTGKVPAKAAAGLKLQREIEGLRQKLQEAISQERYEEAAKLRDLIREKERQRGQC